MLFGAIYTESSDSLLFDLFQADVMCHRFSIHAVAQEYVEQRQDVLDPQLKGYRDQRSAERQSLS